MKSEFNYFKNEIVFFNLVIINNRPFNVDRKNKKKKE